MDEKAQQARDRIVESEKLDGQVANFVRQRVNGDTRLFGPLKSFWDMNSADLALLGAKRAEEIAANAGNTYNPLVAAKFKGFKPTKVEDVFKLYGKLFGEFGSKADAAFASAKADTSKTSFEARVQGGGSTPPRVTAPPPSSGPAASPPRAEPPPSATPPRGAGGVLILAGVLAVAVMASRRRVA